MFVHVRVTDMLLLKESSDTGHPHRPGLSQFLCGAINQPTAPRKHEEAGDCLVFVLR